MKNAKKKFGLVLYRKDKEEIYKKILNETMNKVRMLKGERSFGHGREKQGWMLFQYHARPFLTYRDFDNFLYILSEEMSRIDGLGMVLGHNDDDGFFWMDYPDIKERRTMLE